VILAGIIAVMTAMDPSGTGTRSAAPWPLPVSSGITLLMAFAAPVVDGTMFSAAARPSPGDLGRRLSSTAWLFV
jgi:hypothetical protein